MANKFFLYKYSEGEIVTMKKAHPCGSKDWLVLRAGAEIKLRCQGCGHEVTLARPSLERSTVSVRKEGEEKA